MSVWLQFNRNQNKAAHYPQERRGRTQLTVLYSTVQYSTVLIILMERRGQTQLTAARKAGTATPGLSLILHSPDIKILRYKDVTLHAAAVLQYPGG